jgi:cob(I)alamin adenosyltransferase
VDEAVAALGLARAFVENGELRKFLLAIQRDLFIVGADLATNPDKRERLKQGESLTTADMTERLEKEIDQIVEAHPLPDYFIVPGANPGSAALDLARAAVRRAERRVVEMNEAGHEVNPEALRYLNRLSDLLFAMARAESGGGEEPSRVS